MTGTAESKILIKAKVYIHKKDKSTKSKIIHIDIESPLINRIIKPGESSYVAGKKGGVFIGLKKDMLRRAEKLVKELEKQ